VNPPKPSTLLNALCANGERCFPRPGPAGPATGSRTAATRSGVGFSGAIGVWTVDQVIGESTCAATLSVMCGRDRVESGVNAAAGRSLALFVGAVVTGVR